MSLKQVFTDAAPPPFSAYSQAIEVPAGARTLHLSGQVGVDAAGAVGETPEAQHEHCWRNIMAILAQAGMGPGDLVSITGYVTDPSGVALFRTVRDRHLGGAKPASTLLVIEALADPSWVVEISAVAARV